MTFEINARSLTLFREETKNAAGEAVAFWTGRIPNALATEDGTPVDAEFTGRGLVGVMDAVKALITKKGKTADKAKPFITLGLVNIEAETEGGIIAFDKADGTRGYSQRVVIKKITRAEDNSTTELDALAGV